MITDSHIDALKRFYQVETDKQLLERMDLHIAVLQQKIDQLTLPKSIEKCELCGNRWTELHQCVADE
jgi:hypothetical protein